MAREQPWATPHTRGDQSSGPCLPHPAARSSSKSGLPPLLLPQPYNSVIRPAPRPLTCLCPYIYSQNILSPPNPNYKDMLRLSLARDDYTQSARHSRAFEPLDESESSYSSRRSPSRSPERPTRRTSLPRVPANHPRPASQCLPTLPRSHTHPTDLAAHVHLAPHTSNEQILRSRLEGVLSSACSSRDFSCPPSPSRRGDSLAFGLLTPPNGVPPMTRSRTSPAVSRSSRPSTTSPSPITPPPSPPFDANRASLQLREREGYVSFADIQGLGIPHEPADDEDDVERGRGRWWTLWKG